MSRLDSLRRLLAEDFRRTHFTLDAAGGLVFAPLGTTSLFFRRAYRVPDEAAGQRLTDANIRWTAIGVVCAAVGVFTSKVLIGKAATVFGLPGGVVFAAALAAMVMLAMGLPMLVMLRLGRDLPVAAERSMSEVLATQERLMGPAWVGWLFSAAMLAAAAVAFVHAYQAAELRIPFLVVGTVLVIVAALGPVVLRFRNLRAENERLEIIVTQRTEELRQLNATLEARVREQVERIERLGQLRRFFAPSVADMVLSDKDYDPQKVHRREVTIVSLDLRGFTSFSETAEPEEVIATLRTYHGVLGRLVNESQGTLEHFAGDGVMIFFNDPIPLENHALRALEMALALQQALRPHLRDWRAQGFELGLGVGIATGYATMATVGYEGRWEYAAIGTVTNLAARLCSLASDGQIVVSRRFLPSVGERAITEPMGERALKGFSKPLEVFNVAGLTMAAQTA